MTHNVSPCLAGDELIGLSYTSQLRWHVVDELRFGI